MQPIDTATSLALIFLALLAVVAHFVRARHLRALKRLERLERIERLEREDAALFVGESATRAVYEPLLGFGRWLAGVGVSPHAITLVSLGFAALAGTAFYQGHFGVGAAFGAASGLADALDGIVARVMQAESEFGRVLDTVVDRYVEALLFGGLALYMRSHPVWLGLVFAALVASFMVSYSSSVLRELGRPQGSVSMRRGDRLTCLLVGAGLVPLVSALGARDEAIRLAPLLSALGLIAVIGNVSAVRRLLGATGRPRTAALPATKGKLAPPPGLHVPADGR